jgi:Histidine kinase-, DNA gyrase B-, and HSP90-like ATPase
MKINLNQERVVSNITSKQIELQIENSPKIVRLLAQSLYSQPWKSCVREILTNAIDANIDAGKADRPIEINLSSDMLEITDCGNGMSPQLVEEVLAVLGATTKDGDNLRHGGFGIGILSLFAAASQAQLDTISEGICYRYLLAMDDRGVPGPILIDKWQEVAKVGTTVRVPIASEEDFETVLHALADYLPTIEPTPIYKGKRLSNELANEILTGRADRLSGPGFTCWIDLTKTLHYHRFAIVIRIGSIAYELTHAFKKAGYTKNTRQADALLAVDINIGELELPSSREDYSHTSANFDKIATAVDAAVLNLRERITLAFADKNSAVARLKLFERVSFCKTVGIESLNWQGLEIAVASMFDYVSVLTNLDDWKTAFINVKLQESEATPLRIISECSQQRAKSYVYIGSRQNIRATIRNRDASAFLKPVYIFQFDNETKFTKWCSTKAWLVEVLKPEVIRKKTRAIGQVNESSDLTKLTKWLAKPQGLYELELDDFYWRPFSPDKLWKDIATKIEIFPTSCIYIEAERLENLKPERVIDYRRFLELFGITKFKLVVMTKAAQSRMEVAKQENSTAFANFVEVSSYIDRLCSTYLDRAKPQFETLKLVPGVNSQRYYNSLDKLIEEVNQALEVLDLVLAEDRLVLSEDNLALVSAAREYSLKLAAIFYLQTGRFVKWENEGWKFDPFFKLMLGSVFKGELERTPVLKYLPCFAKYAEYDRDIINSFKEFLQFN